MLTLKELGVIREGEWKTDGPAGPGKGSGVLVFRRSSGALLAYYRYTRSDAKRESMPIGQLDERGRGGMTLKEIRDRAGVFARMYMQGIKDISDHLEAEDKAKKEANEAEQAAKEAARVAQEAEKAAVVLYAETKRKYNLHRLCEAYVAYLRDNGKPSAKDAECAFRVHVYTDNTISELPADAVTGDHIAKIVGKVYEAGKTRMAGVVRSFLLAAYNAAIRARYDATLPKNLKGFNLITNPVLLVPSISVKAGTRTLTVAEMRQYKQALRPDNLVDQALLLALLAGGQRLQQILRLRVADFDEATATITLWDPKGKRTEPRQHRLPLGPNATELVITLIDRARTLAENTIEGQAREVNPSLFMSRGAIVNFTSLGHRIKAISSSMQGEPFDARAIRRAVETQLAGLKISKDDRAQILSHGLSGVQDKHYDRHGYLEEKKSALIRWEQHLEQI